MPLKLWQYELVETRDDVKTEMPDGWKVEVYKVTSGDSGKKYYVQVVHSKEWIDTDNIESEREGFYRNHHFYFCNCPEGIFRSPIAMTGGKTCKHAENLKQFLEEKRRKK